MVSDDELMHADKRSFEIKLVNLEAPERLMLKKVMEWILMTLRNLEETLKNSLIVEDDDIVQAPKKIEPKIEPKQPVAKKETKSEI